MIVLLYLLASDPQGWAAEKIGVPRCYTEKDSAYCKQRNASQEMQEEFSSGKGEFERKRKDWRKFREEFRREAEAPLRKYLQGKSESQLAEAALEQARNSCEPALTYLKANISTLEENLKKNIGDAGRADDYAAYNAYYAENFPKYPGVTKPQVYDGNDARDMQLARIDADMVRTVDQIIEKIKQAAKDMKGVAEGRRALAEEQKAEIVQLKSDEACFLAARDDLLERKKALGTGSMDPHRAIAGAGVEMDFRQGKCRIAVKP